MNTSDQVLAKMNQYVAEYKTAKDLRYVFLSCYNLMSANMVSAINNNEFHDTVWVNALLRRFADYYFNSLKCYDCGDVTSKVWEHAHKITCNKDVSQLQCLILGVNAHINYDLVLALSDLLKPEWESLSETQQRQRYEDHKHVNYVIASTIDRVQDEILEPLNPMLEWVDSLLGRMDEYLISRLITSWREDVWENTQMLLKIEDPDAREAFRIQLENSVLKRAAAICVF
ncbi:MULTISPECIES: DUF5995 family protein [Aequorivita]|uniref:DUF5995 family protein n=2 Tax=Aequorivita TaxID=153265 RepID=A0AB35YVS2_9FLAO|nr:DUF5995 family protein [Aequorivita sp. Ant34-E75]WGF93190.1 DUF5995 family protein [Aequorivita sp. Ant34-E75]